MRGETVADASEVLAMKERALWDVWAIMLRGLLGLACSIEQRVSGPVTLTGEWVTVTPPAV
jgi:hypothetical protein